MTEKPPKKKYKESLDKQTLERYNSKTKCIGVDPYEVPKHDFSNDHKCLPAITYIDILNYLVNYTSAYTMDELRAFKSLEAYNQFYNGWVNDVKSMTTNDRILVVGRVRHSQRMNETALRPWIIASPSGIVDCAHCDCMAGLGESCTHVGALLFYTMEAYRISMEKTATQEKSYWLLPSSIDKVRYSEVQHIDFTTAETQKKHMDCVRNGGAILKRSNIKLPCVPEPTDNEIHKFMDNLFETNARAAILSVKTNYQEHFVPDVLKEGYLPVSFITLRNEEYMNMSGNVIQAKCAEIFKNLNVTEEQCKNAEFVTREQSKSKEWHTLRMGRITASNMKAVCTSSLSTPAISTLNAICGTSRFSNKATQWGCAHEDTALGVYLMKMRESHQNVTVDKCGLHIHPKYPHIGASPDAVVKCDCCGEGIVEIKCPYCIKDMELKDVGNKVSFMIDGRLKTNNRYFYQVQTQLLVTEKEYCDFVVWTEKDISIERITLNEGTTNEILAKSREYFVKIVLPELTGNLISRTRSLATCTNSTDNNGIFNMGRSSNVDLICLCQKPYDENNDEDVIGCDNENCRYVWLHFSCVNIKKVPKGSYYCPECKPHQRKRKRKQ